MTVEDRELLASPGPPPETGPSAWFELVASIGSDVKELNALGQQHQRRRRRAEATKYPAVSAAVVPASGTVTLDLGAPSRGRQWSVRLLTVVDVSNPTGATSVVTTTGTVAGAAAGAVALPAGATLTGFDLTFAPSAATVTGVVQVTGVGTGGTGLNYEVVDTTTGGSLVARYPGGGVPATNPTTQPAVSVPAIVGGGAYALNAYGTTLGAPGSGWWYTGVPSVYGPQSGKIVIPSLPHNQTYSGEQVTVLPADRLFVVISGAVAGRTIVARADVLDTEQGSAPLTETQ